MSRKKTDRRIGNKPEDTKTADTERTDAPVDADLPAESAEAEREDAPATAVGGGDDATGSGRAYDDGSPEAIARRLRDQLAVLDRELEAIGDPMAQSRLLHAARDRAVEERRAAMEKLDHAVARAQAEAHRVHYEVCVPLEGRKQALEAARARVAGELERLADGRGEPW